MQNRPAPKSIALVFETSQSRGGGHWTAKAHYGDLGGFKTAVTAEQGDTAKAQAEAEAWLAKTLGVKVAGWVRYEASGNFAGVTVAS